MVKENTQWKRILGIYKKVYLRANKWFSLEMQSSSSAKWERRKNFGAVRELCGGVRVRQSMLN